MFYNVIYTIVYPFIRLLFPMKFVGKDKLKAHTSGFVVCANHISMLDPIFVGFALTKRFHVCYMGKEELFNNRFLGWFLRKLGAFPVNRGCGAEGLKTAKELLASGKVIGIFPEGTRSKTGQLGKGKAGAAMVVNEVGGYIVPVSISTKNQKVKVFRKTTIVIGDPVYMPTAVEMSQREHLRACTAAIMNPIAEGLEHVKQ